MREPAPRPSPEAAPGPARGVVRARVRRRAPFLLGAWVWSLAVFAVVVLWWHPAVGVAAAVALPLIAVGTAALLLQTPPDPLPPVVAVLPVPGGRPGGRLRVSCTGTTRRTGPALGVHVDGRPVAALAAGAVTEVAVPAGPHRVRVHGGWGMGRASSPELSVAVDAGAVVALECGPAALTPVAAVRELLRPGRALSLKPLTTTRGPGPSGS